MLKRHVLSTHNEVSSFRTRGKQPSKSRRHCHTATSLKAGYKRTMDCPNPLKYNPSMTLTPGTLMTVFKCPVDGCGEFGVHPICKRNGVKLVTTDFFFKIWGFSLLNCQNS